MTVRKLFFTLLACGLAVRTSGALTQEQLDQALQTTVMIRAALDGDNASGAGIVFGRDQENVYIATARHVVARGDRRAEKVEILFRGKPDAWLPATVLEHSDPTLDLAVIRATAAIDPCAGHLERAADTRTLSRGDEIFPVGYPGGIPWGVPATPGRIGRLDPAEIVFESAFLAGGHSGGPLLTDAGTIAGMLQSDAPPFGRALPIGRLLSRLREWGYAVMLREARPGVASPLHVAAEKSDAAAVERELFACANVNARDDRAETPLHKAATKGHTVIATRLLERGAGIDMVSDVRRAVEVEFQSQRYKLEEREQKTPLHLAIEARAPEMALLLIAKGADPNIKASALKRDQHQYLPVTSTPPITLAIEQRLSGVVKALIDKRADVNATVDVRERDEKETESDASRTPVRTAIKNGLPDVLDWLLQAGAKTDASLLRAAIRDTTSCDAKEDGAVAVLQVLLQSRTAFSQSNLNDALENAINAGRGWEEDRRRLQNCFRPRLFELLIAKGADVNGDGGDESPLDLAAIRDSVPLATLLLAKGAKVNLRNRLGMTPLHRAARYVSPGVASLLLKRGAEVDARTDDFSNERGGTPLQYLVQRDIEPRDSPRRLELTRLLLSAGADPNQRGASGRPLLVYPAGSADDAVFAALLLEFKANPNLAAEDGWTPLHEAAQSGSPRVATLLLNRRASLEAKNREGETPLWRAVMVVSGNGGPGRQKEQFQVAQLLVQKGANVNSPTHDTYTMLDHAVSNRDFETARFLLEHGAKGAAITMERLAAASR